MVSRSKISVIWRRYNGLFRQQAVSSIMAACPEETELSLELTQLFLRGSPDKQTSSLLSMMANAKTIQEARADLDLSEMHQYTNTEQVFPIDSTNNIPYNIYYS
jgi:hypothetical protein